MGMLGRHKIIKVFYLLLGLLFVSLAQAEVYRCKDGNGATRFQDQPCEGLAPVAIRSSSVAKQSLESDSPGSHFFWQASSGKGTLYLLGSIHFGTAEMYPLPMVMTSMFNKSDALVVEADILSVDPVQMAQLVASKAMYLDGSNLQQHLSEKTWIRLRDVSVELGMPVELLSMQKPWFVSMTLTALALNKMGFSEEKGIDAHFLSLAKDKKKIVELEGLAWQLALFDQLSTEEQVLMLEETLREIANGKAFFDKMLGYWRTGDKQGIQDLFKEGMLESPGSERLNKLIMTDRNKSMTDKLHAMADYGGSYFVVIGAGHLPGEEGILALLQQRGYQVDQF